MKRKDHPVWQVYDLQRTARLNIKYYSQKLAKLEKQNFFIEIILAITAPSSAISGLFFWDIGYGQFVWKVLAIVSAFLAVLKPLIKLTSKIKKHEETVTGYKTLESDLQLIAVRVEESRSYDHTHQAEFRRALERRRILSAAEPPHKEDKALKRQLQEEVSGELPETHFFIPEE